MNVRKSIATSSLALSLIAVTALTGCAGTSNTSAESSVESTEKASSVSNSGVDEGGVEILNIADSTVLHNEGKDSAQLLWPENAPESEVTITRVTMQPDALSATHSHPEAEQIWLIEQGHGRLLLADGETKPIKAGDLVRTPPQTTHGARNTGDEVLIYLSITTPPEDFSQHYTDAPKTP